MLGKKVHLANVHAAKHHHSPTYGTRYFSESVPKYEMPHESMPPEAAHRIIHDELNLDGNPTLNLASFVTTWMDPQADQLMAECFDKNYIDQDEYPQTTEIHNRCVNMLARLYHAPEHATSVGTGTVGSSEAIMLAGLALKWNWRKRRQAKNKPADKPNLVMGHNVQVVWEKFARYFEVEPRYIPLTETRYVINAEEVLQRIDENTIGVVSILGSTYTGEYEPTAEIHEALEKSNAKTGWEIPIHVDAASGGFVAPFIQPDEIWDFRLPLVKSINVSGHKYGLVYPGIGWVLWRDQTNLPDDLVFHVNYLGGDQPTFNLNFSKGAGQVIAQYYNFLRLGKSGYRRIMHGLKSIADFLADELVKTGRFEILGNGKGLPVVCVRLVGDPGFTVFHLSDKLRERGWIIPAYTMAPNAQDIAVLRVVVREGFSRDMADMLLADIHRSLAWLDNVDNLPQRPTSDGKRHKVC